MLNLQHGVAEDETLDIGEDVLDDLLASDPKPITVLRRCSFEVMKHEASDREVAHEVAKPLRIAHVFNAGRAVVHERVQPLIFRAIQKHRIRMRIWDPTTVFRMGARGIAV